MIRVNEITAEEARYNKVLKWAIILTLTAWAILFYVKSEAQDGMNTTIPDPVARLQAAQQAYLIDSIARRNFYEAMAATSQAEIAIALGGGRNTGSASAEMVKAACGTAETDSGGIRGGWFRNAFGSKNCRHAMQAAVYERCAATAMFQGERALEGCNRVAMQPSQYPGVWKTAILALLGVQVSSDMFAFAAGMGARSLDLGGRAIDSNSEVARTAIQNPVSPTVIQPEIVRPEIVQVPAPAPEMELEVEP